MGDRYLDLYQKYRDLTMIPKDVYIRNLRIAERMREIDGCVVECGVWRGGMIAGIAELLGSNRKYFLFDSFAGLPPAQEIDGAAAREWQADVNGPFYHDNCSTPIEVARQAMQMSGVTDYTIVPGWFQQTLPNFNPPAPIALLRLDGDWYQSTMEALSRLYHFVTDRGLIIVDDYYTWNGCARAVHEFLAQAPALRCVLQFDNDVCVLAPCRFSF